MKKLMSLLLVMTMLLGFGVTALAEEEPVLVDDAQLVEPVEAEAAAEPAEIIIEEDASVEEAAGEAPVEEAAADEAPIEVPPVEEAPAEEAPIDEAPADEASMEEVPADDAAIEEAPIVETAEDAEEAPVLYAGNLNGSFVFTFTVDGVEYAIGANGKAVKYTGQKDPSLTWTASNGLVKNADGGILYFDKGTGALAIVSDSSKNGWSYGSTLYYKGGGPQFNIVSLSGDSIITSDKGTALTVKATSPDGKAPQPAESGSTDEKKDEPKKDEPKTDDAAETEDDGTFNEVRKPFKEFAVEDDGSTQIAFDFGGYTIAKDRGDLSAAKSNTPSDGKLAIEKNAYHILKTENGYLLYTLGGGGNKEYIIVEDGKLHGTPPDKSDAPTGYWVIDDDGPGKGNTYLAYHDGDTVLYMAIVDGELTFVEDLASATKGVVFSGSAADDDPGGGPGGPGGGEKVDESAPSVTKQAEAPHYVIEGSGFEAPTVTIEVKLPEGATDATIQWFVSGEAKTDPNPLKAGKVSFTAASLKGAVSGVYPIYAKLACKVDGEEHTSASYTVNFIVCKGVKENSILTFSDVHEVWDNVGVAIYDTIIAEKGLIPALIVATGDYNNSYVAGHNEEFITRTIDGMINRIALQVAGIDTVWVSGNHDNGYATAFTNANKEADLGVVIEDYQDVEHGLSGTGIIYDSRKRDNADSSAANDGLIVIGVNYEDLGAAQGAYDLPEHTGRGPSDPSKLDYGDADSPDYSVYARLKKALDSIAANYDGELVVISTHAGLHTLGVDPDSKAAGASEWSGGNDYSVTNSAAVVELINSYVEKYDMDIMFLFGHDHSKGEGEIFKAPGDEIISTVSYADKTTKPIELKFTYAHAGYITDNIGGQERYSYITYDDESITREMNVADGEQSKIDELSKDIDRLADKHLKSTAVAAKPVEAAQKAFDDAIAKLKDVDASRTTFYEVTPNWADGTPATNENVKANGGVTVKLPAPAGVKAENIVVLHFVDGKIEQFTSKDFRLDGDTIVLTAKSLSPFAVVVLKEAQQPAKPDTGKKDADKKPDGAPKTGDETNIVVWVAVLVLCAGSAAVLLPRRKNTHR